VRERERELGYKAQSQGTRKGHTNA